MNETSHSSPACSNCGTTLPSSATSGLCPRCLMAAAMNPTMPGDEATAKHPHFQAPSVTELAARLPRLEILEFIGQGGMGAVYKARQPELDRLVALKILPPGVGGDTAFAERFAREAKALAKLNHPNIVTLYEFGSADGLFFVLMEYVDGVNLRQLMAGGRVAAREALAIVPQICDALQFAHDRGIVHRDIKPENILLDRRGAVKVADFGLAKIIGRTGEDDVPTSGAAAPASVLTQASKVMGTPQYMSPEQVQAPSAVDHRADIYALGVVFYQMLTGELPGRTIEPPSRKVHIDVRLDEVVLRAMEKQPELRYQQASLLKTQVETIAGDPDVPHNELRKSPMVHLAEALSGVEFTSRKAMRCANLSALAFLGFLGFLGNLPVPGSQYLFGLFGCFGLFGLMAFAVGIEFQERRVAGMKKIVADMNALPVVNLGDPLSLEAWLALVDAGNYARSWDTAAPNLRIRVQRADWIARLQKIRQPLGKVLTRRLQDTRLTKMGVVFEATHATTFDGQPAATETVAFTRQADGQWQPSGYSVEPAEENSVFNSRKSLVFGAISTSLLLVLVATGNAVAMMVGSALLLLAGLIWFVKGARARTILIGLAAAGIATWSVFFIARFTETTPSVVSDSPSRASLSGVAVDGGKFTITGQALTGSRLAVYAGRRENGWSCGFDHPGGFTATLKKGWEGLVVVVQPNLGRPALTMDGVKNIGETDLLDGELIFRAGQPQEEADGVWSVTIGELVTKSGGKIPIGVALLPPSPADRLPAQLTQEGWKLWQAGKLVEAAAKFQEAVQLAPANGNAWSGLGWAQFNGGDSAAAEQSFLKAVGVDPNLPGALNGLGQVYLSQRRYAEAEKFLLQAAPQAPAAWFGLTRLYLLQGRFEKAETWAQKIVDSGQGDHVTRQMLAAAKQKVVSDELRRLIEPPAFN